MAKKFIQFGCWNQGYCNKSDLDKKPPINSVMRQLETTLKTAKTKHDFIIIAGDNYYPTKPEKNKSTKKEKKETSDLDKKKDKEGKIIMKANLESGFHCLPSDIEINIILGNHDLETSREKKMYIEDTANEEKGDCLIMQLEQAVIREKNDERTDKGISNEISLDLYKHKWLGLNTLVLMVDTSMYDTDDATTFLPCYNVKTGKEYQDIEELHTEQQEFVTRMIDRYYDRIETIIVIGHHPITGYKYKNEMTKLIRSFPGLMNLFLFIQARLSAKQLNYYYLCADLHLYQIGTITITDVVTTQPIMSIKQYIVGTGGTKLDNSPFLMPDLPMPDDTVCFKSATIEASYAMTPEQLSLSTSEKYGFLECELYKRQMYFKFIDADGNKYLENDNIIRKNDTKKIIRRTNKTRKRK